jgi:integrase/recombinase XerD
MSKFDQFIREKKYLQNVSDHTERWYKHALKWLPNENPTKEELKELVVKLREKGLKATGCNAVIRAVNCYLHWVNGGEGKCAPQCPHPRIRQMKEPQAVIETFSPEQVRKLTTYKTKGFYPRRLHLLVLLLLDCGLRITEALNVTPSDLDMDNLLLTVRLGKGRKGRVVAFSIELRKHFYHFLKDYPRQPNQYIFGNRSGKRYGRNNALRNVKTLCKQLGFTAPNRTLHAFRHITRSV